MILNWHNLVYYQILTFKNYFSLKWSNFTLIYCCFCICEYLSYANLNMSAARLILSAVISDPIFSTISFVSFLNRAKGLPKNVIVQSGVNAQTNEVTAPIKELKFRWIQNYWNFFNKPPKKTIPIADAARATSLAKIAKIILDPGKNDFTMLINVGPSGTTSVCFSVGIKNPSKACPAKPFPYWLT